MLTWIGSDRLVLSQIVSDRLAYPCYIFPTWTFLIFLKITYHQVSYHLLPSHTITYKLSITLTYTFLFPLPSLSISFLLQVLVIFWFWKSLKILILANQYLKTYITPELYCWPHLVLILLQVGLRLLYNRLLLSKWETYDKKEINQKK